MKIWAYLFCIACFFLFLELKSVTELTTSSKKIIVNNKEAEILTISQPDGTLGIRTNKSLAFDVILKNRLQVPTSIHWHGLILPNNQDGVAFVTQFPLYPGQLYHYKFPLLQSGTFWMHSHFGLQEQKLLGAPLIIYAPEDEKIADQEVILFLGDFSFKTPSEIYKELQCKTISGDMKKNTSDIVEVEYDAFLTNYHTLESPEVIDVEANKKIRLRIINGASSTNFFISLENLIGAAIAVDGNQIQPLQNTRFELVVAQRIDILVTIPSQGGFFPILAQAEGTDRQTGLVLATKNANPIKLPEKASKQAGALTNVQELNLHAKYSLSNRKVDNQVTVELGGNMEKYIWTLNGQTWPEVTPIIVEKGQRVEMLFKNNTSMSHPMHLHGHVFQVTQINGQSFSGAMRDTVLITPYSTLSIQFDADNPGVWPLHCHILYHLEAGMFTVVRYKDFEQPL
ncbi:multicopper oxidase family protein [Parachlamydia acanthamoebae]|uniref:Multicopper oxidase mco n=1 Tax=Parachlamydia acanthamoebae TaxID=83552 RepID=A0A0C1E6N0_9BACT|nr:multicopper oxidase family protein [Parachlamydia acanthamoebae]KIA76957.1 hypothetical protein DB43_HC00220 [Parachlamydia acanthamoebae]